MWEEDHPAGPSNPDAETQLESRAAGSSNSGADATLDSSAAFGISPLDGTTAREPQSIGPYRLLRRLGEGGMGQVWLAEQTAPVHRNVALKLIKVGACDAEVLQRFRSERQSLAMMEHPAIAKVFDAGAAPDGQPYFVMEYVPGVLITHYCDQKRLSIRQRLELFIKVCEGVQHAHQKAIIHRDLKPANILVTEVDGQPMPRIIDFGLAKATGPEIGDETMMTRAGGFLGTPGYMSPEQAESKGDVDTRTDVYSLGVVLYVLLTGDQPFDVSQWKKQPFYEVLRQLREVDPPPPSAKVHATAEKEAKRKPESSSASSAELRGVPFRQLESLLHGDLDWITMKAIEKDRARRYGTPMELAADVGRYLHNEPVVARPASTAYRLQKYVRRHRVGVAVAAGLVLLLAGFAAMQAVQLRRTTRERDRAARITDFMTSMFKVADPSEARGNSITAREILDKASSDINTGLSKDPELQAQLMYTMGDVYSSLGLDSRAESLFRSSLDIDGRVLGSGNRDTLRAAASLAQSLRYQGHYPEAEALIRPTLDAQRRLFGPRDPDTLRSINSLANTLDLQSKHAEADKLLSDLLVVERQVFGPEHPDTMKTMRNLSIVFREEGHFADAEKVQRETLAIEQRLVGPDSGDTLSIMVSLGNTLLAEGHYADAEKISREVFAIRSRVFGPEHPESLVSKYNLALVLLREGRFAESEKLAREALASRQRALGPEHPDTLMSMDQLGEILSAEGRVSEVTALMREVVALKTKVLGVEHFSTLISMNNLAEALFADGRLAEAEQEHRETLEIRRRLLGPEHPDTLYSMAGLAGTLSHEGRYPEAEQLLQQALQIQVRTLGADSPDAARTTYGLASIAARTGKRDQALSLLSQAIDHGLSPDADLSVATDADLKSLHGDPRFDKIVADAKQRSAPQQPN